MELTNIELTFVQKNIVGMLHRFGGVMRYRELRRRLSATRWTIEAWVKEYAVLLSEGVIREAEIPSAKRRNTVINVVELVAKNLPAYEVRPLRQLKQEAEEDAISKQGWDAFYAGESRKSLPNIGSPYSDGWYRRRAAWQQGWDDAKAFEERMQPKPRILAAADKAEQDE
jgi:hypothetical protein